MARLSQSTAILITFLASCLYLLLTNVQTIEAETINLTWVVTYEYKYLDCCKKLSTAINGQTPGPPINAIRNDIINITVVNNLIMENVAIHWHGIRQFNNSWNDGTDSVNQCSAMPGENFTYQFVVDKAGTYMYHSHYGMQRASGLYGIISVKPLLSEAVPSFNAYEDREIVLSDWYHDSSYEQATKLSSKPYVWIGEPQSLLINGRGKYKSLLQPSNKSLETCDESSSECTPDVLKVSPGKTYRFRIASLTSLSALSFQIEGHNLTVVETDGEYVDPFVTENLYIYSGETYSVLVTANQDPSRNYGISINVIAREPGTPNGFAILNYEPNPLDVEPLPQPPPGPIWNDTNAQRNQSLAIKGRKGFVIPPPKTTNRTLQFLNTQNFVNGYKVWAINNVSHALPDTPYLLALKLDISGVFDPTPAPENYDPGYNIYDIPKNTNATTSTSIYRFPYNITVDVILQNAKTLANDSETHPWHLHGHDFWVLGFGEGQFNQSDVGTFNLDNPIRKNTVPLFPYGWTALRFQTDNPGIWIFHCHIEAHFYLGMLVLFESGSNTVAEPPQQSMGCGKTKEFIYPQGRP